MDHIAYGASARPRPRGSTLCREIETAEANGFPAPAGIDRARARGD